MTFNVPINSVGIVSSSTFYIVKEMIFKKKERKHEYAYLYVFMHIYIHPLHRKYL